MDDRRFDALTRSLAKGTSRRTALKGLFAGVIGGAAITTRLDHAGAQECETSADCGEQPDACTAWQCVEGVCETVGGCPEGETCCDVPGVGIDCVNLNAPDDQYCGACGVTCGPCETCENGTCTPYAEYCPETQQCYSTMAGECCYDNECGCGTCVNGQCSIPECCDTTDCGPCETCQSGTCVPYAEYCPETQQCYSRMIGECCTDEECGERVCTDGHCCPPGYNFCPHGQYCYTEREGECCTDAECGDEVCVDGTCQPCRTDDDCGGCAYCSEGTCYGECSQSQECCDDVCVEIGTCCRGVGEACGLLEVTAAGGSLQLDCCDGLVCCEADSGNYCAECCNHWDCPKGAYCRGGWCEYPETCDHDKDCPKGTCCCKDGTCSKKCCHHHHHPHKPKPTPETPVTTLPATGAGESGNASSAIGAAALGAAAALYAAKKMRETPEATAED